MIKKILNITFVLALISSQLLISFGSGEQEYTLFELEKELLDNNLEYIRLTESLNDKEESFTDAKVQALGVKSADFSDEPYDNYAVQVKENLTPIKTENDYLKTKFEHINLEKKLMRDLKTKFMTIQYESTLLVSMQEDFSLMKRFYEAKIKEKDLGIISEIQFMEFEKTYKESFRNLLVQINKVDREKRNISIMSGLNVSDGLELGLSGISTWDFSDLSIETYIEKVLEESYKLKSISLEKEVAETELSFKHRFAGFTNSKLEMDQLSDKIIDLDRQYDYMINNINYDILSSYNNVLIEKENMDIATINIEKEIREDKSMKLKYDNGLISELDYLKSKINLTRASYNFDIARLSYTMVIEEYKDYYETNIMEFRE